MAVSAGSRRVDVRADATVPGPRPQEGSGVSDGSGAFGAVRGSRTHRARRSADGSVEADSLGAADGAALARRARGRRRAEAEALAGAAALALAEAAGAIVGP